MTRRLRRTGVALILVALLLPMAAATSLADTGPAPTESFKFSSNGYSAQADESQCTVEGDIATCTFSFISVFSGVRKEHGSGAIRGTEVCYSTGIDVFNQVTGEGISSLQENGCAQDVGNGTVIERDLSGATIAPTVVTLEAFSCTEIECGPTGATRDVTLEGTFTATSGAFFQSSRNIFDDGVCVFRDSSRGTSRQAMFSGTVDGEPLELGGEDGFAQIMQGSFSSSSKCAIEG